MSDKPYPEMGDAELAGARALWLEHVERAAGFPSAYFAAKQLKIICDLGSQRGLDGFSNPYPIRYG